jgi:hypothetical protein
MDDTCKIDKLADRLQRFSRQLERIKDLTVHQRINHFYYMQKEVELNTLGEQLIETRQRLLWLTTILEKEYVEIFFQWRDDIRWLHAYQMGMRN